MKNTTPLHRPAIIGMAALGLATAAMLAPAAHADTELDRPEESASTAVAADAEGTAGATGGETAVEDVGEAATGAGAEVTVETGDQATAGTSETSEEVASETGDGLPLEAETAPAGAEPADETAATGNSEQGNLCVDGAADGAAEDQPAAETGTAADTPADLNGGTAEEGTDVEAGVPDAESSGEGTVTDPECAATTPGQADTDTGARDGDETQLPVGGVDAGKGEAAGQDMVLPIATAGAVAAAVGLGAYTLVRRSRSGA